MEEIQTQSDNYRSSSSSASSPASRVPSSNFFYLRKPGSVRQPISFEDSPVWDDTDIEVRMEEGGDSINAATTPASPSLSKLNSGSFPSPPLPEGAVVVRNIAGASLAWKDLTVSIKGKRKYSDKVVKSSNGYALPGTMTVIMGPAKSGKSTLLRALAGRLHDSAKMYGEVFVNGQKSRLPYGSYVKDGTLEVVGLCESNRVQCVRWGFVERETTLIGSLTVREFLYYSALLQLPGFFCQRRSVVEDAILAMSLGDYADKLIGGHCYQKGLPNGERRRVSIARELVMRPHEGSRMLSSPFSSVSALLMMVTLKKLASTGCTLIFTINQSSTEVFGLFDRICLLSNGNTLFFGETLACLQEGSSLKSKGKASNATRIAVLTWRSLLVVSREWKFYWLRLVLYMLLTLCVGTVFSGLGHSLSSVVTRVAGIFVFVSFTSLLSIAGVPAQRKEIKIYACEQLNQHSGSLVFLLGQLLSSIPFLFLISISSGLVFYFLIGLRDEFSLLMYFVLNFFMCLLVNEGLVLALVTIWQDVFWSILTLVCIHGMLENEYIGTSFAVGQVRTISGYQALQSAYEVSPKSNSKWENLLVLLLMAVGYRILVFILLQFRVMLSVS
ncbi:hypothetical protein C3L33_06829, partial [Rhododendron williamsianum]